MSQRKEDHGFDYKFTLQKSEAPDESGDNTRNRKKKKQEKTQKYQCGNPTCNKHYHSYTAFYNHCKKAHQGEFPPNSLVNGKIFAGPSRNRGRPRITKVDAKNPHEIEAMKSENELIEFLGTVNVDKPDKKEDVIVSVQDPVEQVNKALSLVNFWGFEDQEFVSEVRRMNEAISSYDLPQFYDPIEYDKFPNQVDTYNFVSIVKFLEKPQNRIKCLIKNIDLETIRIVTIIWLARIVSVSLLAQVIYVLGQDRMDRSYIVEKDFLVDKSKRFLQVIGRFFKCYDQYGKTSVVKQQMFM